MPRRSARLSGFPSSVVPDRLGAVWPTVTPTFDGVPFAPPQPARSDAAMTKAMTRATIRGEDPGTRERVVEPPYLTVIVPVIDGWTSQMNEYVPASSAGTW